MVALVTAVVTAGGSCAGGVAFGGAITNSGEMLVLGKGLISDDVELTG